MNFILFGIDELMSVLQLNIWTCDLCGKIETQSDPGASAAYDCPEPPEGWDEMFEVPVQYQTALGTCDACPDCQASPNWANYRGERRRGVR